MKPKSSGGSKDSDDSAVMDASKLPEQKAILARAALAKK